MMGFWNFYRRCVRHAPRKTWGWVGSISTVATFGLPLIAKLFPNADQELVNIFIILSPLIAFVICVIIVSFLESFRLFQETEREKTRLADQFSSEQEQLRQDIHSLQIQIEDMRTPKVEIVHADPGTWNYHFRVTIKNRSKGGTVKNCVARIVRTVPPMHHLPAKLHWMHETRPHSAYVDLRPDEEGVVDVFRYNRQPGKLDVAVAAQQDIFIPIQLYRITLCVNAENSAPIEKDFVFEPLEDGKFAFYAAPSEAGRGNGAA